VGNDKRVVHLDQIQTDVGPLTRLDFLKALVSHDCRIIMKSAQSCYDVTAHYRDVLEIGRRGNIRDRLDTLRLIHRSADDRELVGDTRLQLVCRS
jgi:hypothetical protein